MIQRRLTSDQYGMTDLKVFGDLEETRGQKYHLVAQNLEDLDSLRDAWIWCARQHLLARVSSLWRQFETLHG